MARPKSIPGRVLLVASAFGLLLGCDRGTQSPQQRAYYLFVHSQFDAAVQACDEALDSTDQPKELADLHLLRGRCFVEQAHRLQKAGQDGLASAKLKDADAAFTRSIKTLEGAQAHYCRSLVHEMMGNKELALKDGEIARKLDETYPMAYINEPVEELIDLRRPDEDENKQVDPQAQAAADGPSTGVTDEATVEGDRFDGTRSATDESEEATRGRAPVATRGPAAGTPVLQRQSPGNLTSRSDQARSTEYRGQPPSAGELSTAVPRTQTGPQVRRSEAAAGQGFGAERTFSAADGLGDGAGRSESQAGEDEDLADDSSDTPSSEEDLADEPTESPRSPVIWPPPVGPWSVTGQPPGMSLPTTGLGGAPVWGSTPYSAGVPMRQVPTTGIVGPPGLNMNTQNPWTMGWGISGALASPFAAPTTGIGGSGWPTTQVGPGVPLAPAPPGPAMPPNPRSGIGLQGPMVGPTPTQSLPTTGVQRSVTPYPR